MYWLSHSSRLVAILYGIALITAVKTSLGMLVGSHSGNLMTIGTILSSVASGIIVAILIAIARGLHGVRRDFHKFMEEHLWLLATTTWTRDKVIRIMAELGMSGDNPPPSDIGRQ